MEKITRLIRFACRSSFLDDDKARSCFLSLILVLVYCVDLEQRHDLSEEYDSLSKPASYEMQKYDK